MNLQTAIKRATTHLLKSKQARTYQVDNKSYVLEVEQIEGENWLGVTTWGFDYEGISIPQSRPELIALKIVVQLLSDPVSKVALRYYLDILRREA